MIVIEKEVFRLHLPMDEKKNWSRFMVVLTKEMQGGNINASRLNRAITLLIHLTKKCRAAAEMKCKLNILMH